MVNLSFIHLTILKVLINLQIDLTKCSHNRLKNNFLYQILDYIIDLMFLHEAFQKVNINFTINY